MAPEHCYFCLMIEGSGFGTIPLTSGSGSGRPINMWIRWIRNTAVNCFFFLHESAEKPVDSSWQMLEKYSRHSPEYVKKAAALVEQYHPIELNNTLTSEQKTPHIVQWFTQERGALKTIWFTQETGAPKTIWFTQERHS
jgi:hypothetical protein